MYILVYSLFIAFRLLILVTDRFFFFLVVATIRVCVNASISFILFVTLFLLYRSVLFDRFAGPFFYCCCFFLLIFYSKRYSNSVWRIFLCVYDLNIVPSLSALCERWGRQAYDSPRMSVMSINVWLCFYYSHLYKRKISTSKTAECEWVCQCVYIWMDVCICRNTHGWNVWCKIVSAYTNNQKKSERKRARGRDSEHVKSVRFLLYFSLIRNC